MILRLLVAIVGAGLITVTMLYGMSEFAAMFRQRNGDKLFLVTDILPRPDPGRPVRPPAAALPPNRPALDYRQGNLGIPLEAPTEPEAGLAISPEAVAPTLDERPAPSE